MLTSPNSESANAANESAQDTADKVERVEGLRTPDWSPQLEHHEKTYGQKSCDRDGSPPVGKGLDWITERDEGEADSNHNVGRRAEERQDRRMRMHPRS